MATIENYKDKLLQGSGTRILRADPFTPAYKIPSAPTNFTVTKTPKESIEGIYVVRADLSWDASPDVVSGYIVYYRLVGSTNIDSVKVKDNFISFDVVPINQSYDAWITAENVNVESPSSTMVTEYFPIDAIAPSPPSNLTFEHALASSTIKWTNPTDADFKRTEVIISPINDKNDFNAQILLDTPANSHTFNDIEEGKTWYFWLISYDFSGNPSTQYPVSDTAGISTVTASTYTYLKPATVSGVSVSQSLNAPTPEGAYTANVSVSWTALTQNFTGYRIRFALTGTTNYAYVETDNNSYDFLNILVGESYDIWVKGMNVTRHGNYSILHTEVVIGDTVAPSAPSSLTADLALGTATLHWVNPTDSDFSYTTIYFSETNDKSTATVLIDETSATSHTFNNIAEGITWYFWLTSDDYSGNTSAQYPLSDTAGIAITSVATYDYAKPGIPANLTLSENVSISPADGIATITGQASWDAVAETHTTYRVRVAENPSTDYAYFDTTALFYKFNNVDVGTVYDVWVRAINQTRKGDYSAVQQITILGDTTPPSPPSALNISTGVKDATITWTNPSDDDFKETEILFSQTNDMSTATVLDTIAGERLYYDNLIAGDVWYAWASSFDNSRNRSTYYPATPLAGESVTIGSAVEVVRVINKITDLGSVASGTVTPDFDNNTNIFKLNLTGAGVTINPPTITVASGQVVDGRINITGGDTYQPIWGAGWGWGDDGEPEMLSKSLIGYTKANGDATVTGWQYGRTADDLLKFA